MSMIYYLYINSLLFLFTMLSFISCDVDSNFINDDINHKRISSVNEREKNLKTKKDLLFQDFKISNENLNNLEKSLLNDFSNNVLIQKSKIELEPSTKDKKNNTDLNNLEKGFLLNDLSSETYFKLQKLELLLQKTELKKLLQETELKKLLQGTEFKSLFQETELKELLKDAKTTEEYIIRTVKSIGNDVIDLQQDILNFKLKILEKSCQNAKNKKVEYNQLEEKCMNFINSMDTKIQNVRNDAIRANGKKKSEKPLSYQKFYQFKTKFIQSSDNIVSQIDERISETYSSQQFFVKALRYLTESIIQKVLNEVKKKHIGRSAIRISSNDIKLPNRLIQSAKTNAEIAFDTFSKCSAKTVIVQNLINELKEDLQTVSDHYK